MKRDELETKKVTNKDENQESSKLLDIFEYVKEHKSEKSEAISNDLNLLGDLEAIGYNSGLDEI